MQYKGKSGNLNTSAHVYAQDDFLDSCILFSIRSLIFLIEVPEPASSGISLLRGNLGTGCSVHTCMKDEEYYEGLLKELFPANEKGQLESAAKWESGRPVMTIQHFPEKEKYRYEMMINKATPEYGKFNGRYESAKAVIEQHDIVLKDRGIEIGERKP